MNISDGERAFIIECASLGYRLDGRSNQISRRAEIQCDVIPQASGSARVRLGATDVFVGIKVELGEPPNDAPDCGRIEFFVDYAPCGTQDIEEEASELMGHELGDVLTQICKLDKRTKKSAGIDMRAFCIVEGRSCFVLYVDAMVLNVDGNVLGAISIATRAAVEKLAIPNVEVSFPDDSGLPEIEVDEENCRELDTTHWPLILTIGCLGSQFVLDMSSREEASSDFAFHVAVDRNGQLWGATSSFKTCISVTTLASIWTLAKEAGKQLHVSMDEFLRDRIETETNG